MSGATILRLSYHYEPDMWDLRKRIAAARKQGEAYVVVQVQAPITSDPVDVALLSGSLYLIGVRGRSGQWNEFAPESPNGGGREAALLPRSKWIMVGSRKALSTYGALQLGPMIEKGGGSATFNRRPTELLAYFSAWNGELNVDWARLHMCVLVFLVCEALRFRSIERAAYDYVWAHGWRRVREAAAASGREVADVRTSPPDLSSVDWPVFAITREMLRRVQSWAEGSAGGDPDVWTWLPGMSDRLID